MAAIIDNRYWNNDLTTKNTGMDLFGLGSAISGIAGAFATSAASKRNLKALRETNAMNLQLARELNDWNLALWNRENAYNTPSAKLLRMQEAGLNPLFFGLDGANTAPLLTSANLANQEAPQLDVGAIGSSVSSLTASLFNAALVKIAEKQIANESRRLDLIDQLLRAQYPQIEANTKRETNAAALLEELAKTEQKIQEKYDKEIDNLVKDGVIKEETAALLKAQTALAAENTRLIQEYLKTEKSKQALNYALTGEAKEGAKLKHAEMVTINSRRKDELRKLAAEADCSEKEADEIVARIAKINAETNLAQLEEQYKKILTELEQKFGSYEKAAKIIALGGAALKNILEGITEVIPQTKAIKEVGKTLQGTPKDSGFDPYKGWDPSNTSANPWLD